MAHKISQNMDSGTGSQLSKYNSTCWRWKIITSQLLMLLIRWTSEATEWIFMTNCPSSFKTFFAAPASQAYVEMGFSVCGLLTAGRRNRMTKSLQMRACLKLNKKVSANTGINASVWTLELQLQWKWTANKLALKLQYSTLLFGRFFVAHCC